MHQYDAADMQALLRQAGQRALAHFGNTTPAWKANRTYITAADLEVQAFLQQELARRFPDDGIIGEEENLNAAPRQGGRYWVIDPIDGTALFVRGFPEWGVAVGLLSPERALGGFFYLPCADDLFFTTPDGAVWRNSRRVTLAPPEPDGREAVLLAGARLHHHFRVAPSYRGKVRSLGSTIAHLCYVAAGSADAAFVNAVAVWDLAAGLAMVLLNGGVAEYLDGRPVSLADLLNARKAAGELLIGSAEAVAFYRNHITRLP